MVLILATKSADKIREMKQITLSLGLEVKSLIDVGDFLDVEETGRTLEENAMKKARAVCSFSTIYDKKGKVVVSDDTGLEIVALSGEPGVFSARYASLVFKDESMSHNSEENMRAVLEKMKGISNRSARFRTVVGIAGIVNTFDVHGYFETMVEGVVEGSISESRRGNNNFGYDPIFIPHNGNGQTFAEMTWEEKTKFSHRTIAVTKAINLINTLFSNGKAGH